MHWETGEKLWSWESFQVVYIGDWGLEINSRECLECCTQIDNWPMRWLISRCHATTGLWHEGPRPRIHIIVATNTFPPNYNFLSTHVTRAGKQSKMRMGWPSIKRLPSCRADWNKVGGRSDSVVARCCSPNDVSPLPSVISEKHYLPSINYLFYPWHFIIFGGAWGDQEQGVDERGKSCWRQLCEKSKLTFAFWLSLSDRRFGGSNTQWARVSMIQRWNNLHSYLKITLAGGLSCKERKIENK